MRVEKLNPVDVTGMPIKMGDIVRIIGVPDLEGMSATCRSESEPVFEYLLGRYKRVRDFDESGFAQLVFSITEGKHKGCHIVLPEPPLLCVERGAGNL